MKKLTIDPVEHTLSNGLRVIYRHVQTDVTYCGFAIDAGTRDELPQEQGMAHFVEHMVFKGTTHRKAWHILNRMEAVGGDLNAYTNKEETVIYSAFLASDMPRAIELLCDIVFNSTYPQKEIDKEVEVIIDEIQSYEDNPSELIFDDFEDLLFQGHALGRNILGRPDQLKQFTTQNALDFTQRLYQPENMIFFIQGNIDIKKVIRLLEKNLKDIPTGLFQENKRSLPLPYQPQNITIHKDTNQAHVMIGSRGYSAYNDKRTALYLLNNILGGPGMNSRLNVSLRERRGLVYNVESNLTSYTDTGAFSIYFGTDVEDVDKCLQLTHKELQKLRDVEMNSSQLQAAKKQLIGQIRVASDNYENNALGMAKIFLHYRKFENLPAVCKRIEAVTTKELLDVANEMFDPNYLSTLIFK